MKITNGELARFRHRDRILVFPSFLPIFSLSLFDFSFSSLFFFRLPSFDFYKPVASSSPTPKLPIIIHEDDVKNVVHGQVVKYINDRYVKLYNDVTLRTHIVLIDLKHR